MILHIMCVQILKKRKKKKKKERKKKRERERERKKRSTYPPSQFSGQKGKQAFYFFRPYLPHTTFRFYLIYFQLTTDFPSHFFYHKIT